MKQLFRCATLLVLIVLANSTRARGQEIRACDFEVKTRCASGDARVTLADVKVTRLEVDVLWCNLQGGAPTFICAIDSSRAGQNSEWSENAGATVIANRSPWNSAEADRVKVTVADDVSIDFSEAQSLGRCGAGAELPAAIVIPAHGKTCRVRLQSP
jgi:hypothetical protein